MGMIFFLVSFYLLNANGIVVPDGCFIAIWVLTIVSFVLTVFSSMCKK